MNVLKTASKSISKHSPEILTGIGVAGLVTTVVLAVKATPKAMVLLEEHLMQDQVRDGVTEGLFNMMDLKTTVKVAWRPYIPAMVMGTVTIACIIGSQRVSSSRTAALASAYSLTSTALDEYQNKVVETIGKNKEEKMRAEIVEERVKADPPSLMDLPTPDCGKTLCFDQLSGRYFMSDAETLRQTVNELNRQMILENELSLNEFYYAIGLSGIPLGASLGWSIDTGLIELRFNAVMSEDNMTPCLGIDYQTVPRYF